MGVDPIFFPKKIAKKDKNFLIPPAIGSKGRLAQFRTCLWSRVSWWASGQEAGQPPALPKRLG